VFAARHALPEFVGFSAQLFVAERLDLRLKSVDRYDGFLVLLDEALVAAAKDGF